MYCTFYFYQHFKQLNIRGIQVSRSKLYYIGTRLYQVRRVYEQKQQMKVGARYSYGILQQPIDTWLLSDCPHAVLYRPIRIVFRKKEKKTEYP
jgi:hypothetical protein